MIEPTFGSTITRRIDVTKTDYDFYEFYEDAVYAAMNLAKEDARLLENDIIAFYGECAGMPSYTSILGQKSVFRKLIFGYFSWVKYIYPIKKHLRHKCFLTSRCKKLDLSKCTLYDKMKKIKDMG